MKEAALLLVLVLSAFFVVKGEVKIDMTEENELGQWAVQVHHDHDPSDIARRNGFRNLGQVGNLEGFYLFELEEQHKRNAVRREESVDGLKNHPGVLWLEKQVLKERVHRPHKE